MYALHTLIVEYIVSAYLTITFCLAFIFFPSHCLIKIMVTGDGESSKPIINQRHMRNLTALNVGDGHDVSNWWRAKH